MTRPSKTRVAVSTIAATALVATGLVAVNTAPAAAAVTWTTPVEAAPSQGAGQNGGAFIDLSRDGKQLSYIYQSNGGTWFAANVATRTGDTTWSLDQLSLPSDTFTADWMDAAEDGDAVAYAYSENYQEASAGPRGNRVVSGAWQGPGSATSFDVGGWTSYVTISDNGNRIAYRRGNAIKTATWAANGTPGAPHTIVSSGFSPFLSGDGQSIAYGASDGVTDQLFVTELNGSTWTPTQVSTSRIADVLGISASGDQIFYEDYATNNLFAAKKVGNAWVTKQLADSRPEGEGVAADGSIAWKDYDSGNLWVALFRAGDWEVENLGGDVERVSISDNGQTVGFGDDTDSYAPNVVTYGLDGWGTPFKVSSANVNATAVSGDGCSFAYNTYNNSSAVYYSQLSQPCAPATVTATAVGNGSAKVQWPASSPGLNPTTSYKVQAYRNGSPVAGKTCTATAPFTNPISCTVSGLTVGQKYTFRVAGVSSDGVGTASIQSNEVTITGGGGSTKPSRPRAVTVKGGPNASKYVMRWKVPASSPAGPVKGYRLVLRQVGTNRLMLAKTLKSSVYKYTFTRPFLLKNSARSRGDVRGQILRYLATVRAVNVAGVGPLSGARFKLKIGARASR